VYQRAVDPEDRSTSLPRRSDTVPNWTLAFTAGVPFAVIGLAQIDDPSWHDVHHASLAMAEAFVLTLLTTVALKRAVGRLRPDFLDRCQPDASGVCTGDPDDILEGRQSFPSGHTSLSFAGGTFLTLYLWGKLQPFRTGGALWKLLVILAPMAVATAVGVTRISDHRHHWEDVLGGGIIGFGYAMLSYRLHYGWPWSQDGGTPTRRRRWAAFPVVGTGHLGVVAQGRF
jgi:membrane-associated phospholipid phosphatase